MKDKTLFLIICGLICMFMTGYMLLVWTFMQDFSRCGVHGDRITSCDTPLVLPGLALIFFSGFLSSELHTYLAHRKTAVGGRR